MGNSGALYWHNLRTSFGLSPISSWNKTNGFFIECGGYDGQYLSNTLFMERSLNWNGLLIEADKNIFKKLLTRNRKTYTSPVCLSKELYPMEVIKYFSLF
ncbi:hypothetical protein OUZ56_012164 [Daphnia magna]|uniref:Methyltransferase FkbM domain-containing protein n=1 Tax=Daphnia magna TaxID=35525 RepID=A0ABQ9Z2J1_9CRUS|nr:hypothetical protein OUZ56_012164 [Daphnia magna]